MARYDQVRKAAFNTKNANRRKAKAELVLERDQEWQRNFSRSLRKALRGKFGTEKEGIYNLAVIGTLGVKRGK